jgi:hypothetical protein
LVITVAVPLSGVIRWYHCHDYNANIEKRFSFEYRTNRRSVSNPATSRENRADLGENKKPTNTGKGIKLKVTNIHYDITETQLLVCFHYIIFFQLPLIPPCRCCSP